MIPRHISPVLIDPVWGRQIRLLVGPRGAGKTTLAKAALTEGWSFLDEVHLAPRWSADLRKKWEGSGPNMRMVLSGSARLDLLPRVYKDLEGSFDKFHLFPLSLSEAVQSKPAWPDPEAGSAESFLKNRLSGSSSQQEAMERLLKFSGFPDSFVVGTTPTDSLDLQALAPKLKTASLAKLLNLLSEQVGTPLSTNRLKEISPDTYHQINNGLELLHLGFATFEVRSYAKKMPKELAKEKKIYLFNWTLISDEAKRFENYVAHELNSWVKLWNDAGLAHFELRTLRQEEKLETDFLIVCERKPWFLVEASLTAHPLEPHHKAHAEMLGGIPLIQVVKQSDVLHHGENKVIQVSASRFFA